MYYWEYILMGLLLLPAMIFAMYAQFRVHSVFNKFSQTATNCGLTGSEVSKRILEKAGASAVQVGSTRGTLTDHYNPANKTVNLSEPVYQSTSIAAIGVAAHETGHALQDKSGYKLMKLRTAVIKASNFASSLCMPLILIGIVLFFVLASSFAGHVLIWVSVGIFALSTLVNLITLPVEINASRRALKQLDGLGILVEEEREGVKSVLSAAALTYVASLAISLISLFRLVFLALMVTGRNKD